MTTEIRIYVLVYLCSMIAAVIFHALGYVQNKKYIRDKSAWNYDADILRGNYEKAMDECKMWKDAYQNTIRELAAKSEKETNGVEK